MRADNAQPGRFDPLRYQRENAELDAAWAEAFRSFAKSGNWGGVESGVTHHKTWGTAWGGYILVQADDPEAFSRYQTHHLQEYGHAVHITFEPLWDLAYLAFAWVPLYDSELDADRPRRLHLLLDRYGHRGDVREFQDLVVRRVRYTAACWQVGARAGR